MTHDVYRKRGRVVRYEDGTLLDVAERGIAWERDGAFFCEPEPSPYLPSFHAHRVVATAEAIRELVPAGVLVERCIVSEGRAEHSFKGRTWSDETERIHLALARGRLRVVVDAGSFDLADVRLAADALARADDRERPAPGRLCIAPAVSAALIAGLAVSGASGIDIVQSAGGVDGLGASIEAWPVGRKPWPNWYRPSYRVRPQRYPMNVRAVAEVEEPDGGSPRAVALLEPPRGNAARVLVDDGASAYPCTIVARRVRAVSSRSVWYPFGAGSFGAEMML